MSFLIKHFCGFGEFTIDTDQRVLLRAGRPVPLTPKVFEMLLVLVENSGRIVEKTDLMNRLWPDSFVEEANLTSNILQLRKTLGDNARKPIYVETVARRGYRFIAEVEEVSIDSSTTGGQINGQFGTSVAKSLENGARPDGEMPTQAPPQAVRLAKDDTVVPTANAGSIRASRRPLALAAVLAGVLAGGGLVSWEILSWSNKKLSENNRIAPNSQAQLPLKVEKLTGTGQSNRVAISPDGKYLAYTRGFNEGQSIWLRQLATNTNVETVSPGGIVYSLAFANTGDYLYFVRGNPTGLYRVSLLGGVPVRILDRLEGNFSLSSDDTQIAFIRKADREGQRVYSLVIASSGGENERTLLVSASPNRLDVPLWSPDGQSIICAIGRTDSGGQDVSILEVGVADGKTKELSSDRFFKIVKMAWLPHKRGLIISAAKVEVVIQLWRLSFPGLELTQVTSEPNSFADLGVTADGNKAVASEISTISDIWVGSSSAHQGLKKITQAIDNFCWTPNGQLIYSSMASGNRDLWIMQRNGSEQRQLTTNAGINGNPAVTPDSSYIVFISNRTGAFQVWRMKIDGSDQVQLTNKEGANFPSVSADGKWVVYNATDNWHLWRVPIEGGEPIELTEYSALYPSVSPDGRMIACVGRNESKSEVLILPFEAGQPVKRIDLAGRIFAGTRIQWTPDGRSLLYPGELGGTTAIIKLSLDGGAPQETASFDEDDLFDFGYSVEGRFLAVTRGGWQQDIVLISGLDRL